MDSAHTAAAARNKQTVGYATGGLRKRSGVTFFKATRLPTALGPSAASLMPKQRDAKAKAPKTMKMGGSESE
jgi:hypothetical protein